MSKKQFSFFTTQDDLVGILDAVASKCSFYYVKIDDVQDGVTCIKESTKSLIDISISTFGDQNRDKSYLLIGSETVPKLRSVEIQGKKSKLILDQLSHPESVVLRPGGVFGKFECIIAGQIGTISEDKWSVELYKCLFAEFKKQCTKIKSFYVGKNAIEKLDGGVRLTTNIRSPAEYDLSR